MQQVIRRIHTYTHTGEGGSMDESKFDAAFAAMVAGGGGSDKGDSSDHMGNGNNTAGTFRHMNGSDSTSSMYVCMQVCMFACVHEYMYV